MKRDNIKQVPRFDFIPQEKWKRLSKDELSHLRSYRSVYRHLKKTLEEIDKCKDRIKVLNDRVGGYYPKLMKINKDIDHLRETYDFSVSIVVGRNYKRSDGKVSKYYNICISRRNLPTKNSTIGTKDKIIDHLNSYYKGNDRVLNMIKKDWLKFLKNECKIGDGYYKILDQILESPQTFHGSKLSLETIFPLK